VGPVRQKHSRNCGHVLRLLVGPTPEGPGMGDILVATAARPQNIGLDRTYEDVSMNEHQWPRGP